MKRICMVWSMWAICCVPLLGLSAQAAPPSDLLLPTTTQAYLSIANFPEFQQAWEKTQVHALMEDAAVQPFIDDLHKQMETKFNEESRPLGLLEEDVRGVATGELSLGLLQDSKGRLAWAMLVDVKGQEEAAKKLLDKVAGNLIKQGGKRKDVQVSGTTVVTFDLPPRNNSTRRREAAMFLKGDLLAAFDGLEAATVVIKRLAKPEPKGALASLVAYQAVMKRCDAAASGEAAQARFFVNPYGLATTVRATRDKPNDPNQTDYLKLLKNQGFDAIQGVGGHVNFVTAGHDLHYRLAVHAPQPYKLAMQMLKLPNTEPVAPADWVPAHVATHIAFNLDSQNAFERFSTLFNEMFGDGDSEAFEGVLEGLKEDEEGPRTDVRAELVAHLGNRVTIVSEILKPIEPGSDQQLIAVVAKDEKALLAGVTKFFKGDPDVKTHKVGDHDVWEMLPVEDEETPREKEKKVLAEENTVLTVANGHLLISTHLDLLKRVLETGKPEHPLAADPDYLAVEAAAAKLRPESISLQGFSRTAEEYRTPYELFRQGRLPEAKTVLAQILNEFLSEEPEGTVRKARFDASKLPEFDVVSHYLQPGGSYGISEDDGWFFMGFVMGKPAAAEPTAAASE